MFLEIANLLKNKKIIKKFLFTFLIIFIYEVGSYLTVPGFKSINIDTSKFSVISMMSILGGGTIEKMSLFSLGVSPYITASLIIQIGSMGLVPFLSNIKEEGNKGQKKIEKYTRYLCVVVCLIQGFFSIKLLSESLNAIQNPSLLNYLYIDIIFTAGTMTLLWLGDQITTKGIGNGISIIIFTGIVSRIPNTFKSAYNTMKTNTFPTKFVLYLIAYLLIVIGVIVIKFAERRIPVQQSTRTSYSKKGQPSYLPIKVNSADVMPVIFASALVQAPLNIASWINVNAYEKMSKIINFENYIFLIVYALIIIVFTFLYSNLQVDPKKISEELAKSGQYIPGIRPGFNTRKYLTNVLNSITYLGAVFLALLTVAPYILSKVTGLPELVSLGGTGVIIMVGVATETVEGLICQTTKNKYENILE